MSSNESRSFSHPPVQAVLDVSEYCKQSGVAEAEERRLIILLGPYASRHELQMNILRAPFRSR